MSYNQSTEKTLKENKVKTKTFKNVEKSQVIRYI